MEEVDLEEAIARLKLCMGMSLHGGEQTIVNIKDLEKVLKVHQELQDEFFWQQVRITNEFIPKSKVKEVIDRKCKAFRHRTSIEKILECEFKRLEEELLREE